MISSKKIRILFLKILQNRSKKIRNTGIPCSHFTVGKFYTYVDSFGLWELMKNFGCVDLLLWKIDNFNLEYLEKFPVSCEVQLQMPNDIALSILRYFIMFWDMFGGITTLIPQGNFIGNYNFDLFVGWGWPTSIWQNSIWNHLNKFDTFLFPWGMP